MVVGFGPKGMPGRMCDIVRWKWGHTNKQSGDNNFTKAKSTRRLVFSTHKRFETVFYNVPFFKF